MKKKILILLLLTTFILSINTVSAIEYTNGTLFISGYSEQEYENIGFNSQDNLDLSHHMKLHYKSHIDTGIPVSIKYDDVRCLYIGDYEDIPINIGAPFLIYEGQTLVGSGNVYFHKTGERSVDLLTAEVTYYFDDDTFIPGNDKIYDMYVYMHVVRNYITGIGYETQGTNPHPDEYTTLNIGIQIKTGGTTMYGHGNSYNNIDVTYKRISEFKNDYSIAVQGSISNSSIYRIQPGYEVSSKLVIRNSDNSLYFETGFSSVNTSHIEGLNLTHKYYIEPQASGVEHFIYGYEPYESTESTLEFNQSTYIINEIIEFEYHNLDNLHDNNKTYDLQFYYYINDDEINYLYNIPLQTPLDNYDDIGYLHTEGWTPKKLYYALIDSSISYKSSKNTFLANTQLSGYVNLMYNYEFVFDTCEGEYCEYKNDDTFNIVYNSFDNYTLYLYDDNDSIVQNLGNINGFGTITYTIPIDENHIYNYPSWKLEFNSTINDTIIVYWSITEEDDYYEQEEVNETIQDNINEMKEGIKPLFDLAFGLSTIVVDNPDYDNNGITSTSELDHWFNSIISLVILIALYIFYKGLKDKR